MNGDIITVTNSLKENCSLIEKVEYKVKRVLYYTMI